MDIYKRIMAYVNCVADIQHYLTQHVFDIPAGTIQDLNAIIIKLLDQLKKDE